MQGARSGETGMYLQYMRISSTAQRRITSHLAAVFFGSLVEWLGVPSDAIRSNFKGSFTHVCASAECWLPAHD